MSNYVLISALCRKIGPSHCVTVVRTYNSLNPLSTDFGFGWSYSLLGGMDVQLDDERRDVTIGDYDAPFADDETDDNGLPKGSPSSE
jgi:hypothetical protein